METTPKNITPKILELCDSLVDQSEVKLQYIDVLPENYARYTYCFNNVEEKISIDGGKLQYGWTIWEWPHIIIEAEFHAVWVNSDGKLIDITPKPDGEKKILFLPDNKKQYEGEKIFNVRVSMNSKPIMKEYIKNLIDIEDAIEKKNLYKIKQLCMLNMMLVNEIIKNPIIIGRNDICDCGSEKKYKKCCGR